MQNNIYYDNPKPRKPIRISIKHLIQEKMENNIKFKTNINASGTSLVGYIDLTYDDIVSMLGEDEGSGDKTLAQWTIKFEDGQIATIYDWKNYGWNKEEVTHWHIGGKSDKVLELVQKLFPNFNVYEAGNAYQMWYI